jgi:hypothetical protein
VSGEALEQLLVPARPILVNIIFDIVLTGSVELGSQKSPLPGTDELLHA